MAQRDFICDENSYLNISNLSGDPQKEATLKLYRRSYFFRYSVKTIAYIDQSEYIRLYPMIFASDQTLQMSALNSCKNSEGKTPLEVYKLIKNREEIPSRQSQE